MSGMFLSHATYGTKYPLKDGRYCAYFFGYEIVPQYRHTLAKMIIKDREVHVGTAYYTLDGYPYKIVSGLETIPNVGLVLSGAAEYAERAYNSIARVSDTECNYQCLYARVSEKCSIESVLRNAETYIGKDMMLEFLRSCLGHDGIG